MCLSIILGVIPPYIKELHAFYKIWSTTSCMLSVDQLSVDQITKSAEILATNSTESMRFATIGER